MIAIKIGFFAFRVSFDPLKLRGLNIVKTANNDVHTTKSRTRVIVFSKIIGAF